MRANGFLEWGALALGAMLSAACGGNVAFTGSGGGGGGTTTSHGTSSGTTTVTGTGGEPAPACGGFIGTQCSAGEYCAYLDQQCGGNDGPGICTPRPAGCDDLYDPVCGCDGKVYPNACTAQSVGVDIDVNGGCTPPPSYFACGPHFCVIGKQYCQMIGSDVAEQPSVYQCNSLPATCGAAPDCACLSQEMCGQICTSPPGGGLKVTCPGG